MPTTDPLANVALGHFVETPILKMIPSNIVPIVSNFSQTLTTGALLVANTSSQAPLSSQTHAISSTKIVTSVTQSCPSGALLGASTISQPVPPAQSNPNVSVAQSKADTGHSYFLYGADSQAISTTEYNQSSFKCCQSKWRYCANWVAYV